jgi:hypothetical protein
MILWPKSFEEQWFTEHRRGPSTARHRPFVIQALRRASLRMTALSEGRKAAREMAEPQIPLLRFRFGRDDKGER